MLCSLVCSALGRHVHVDYCRAEQGNCHGQQLEHIDAPMLPRPDKPKDYISHPLFWERIGFKGALRVFFVHSRLSTHLPGASQILIPRKSNAILQNGEANGTGSPKIRLTGIISAITCAEVC